MSKMITFYSYKGGVGRTMALANVGVVLSKWGYKVLMVDWDLEAPGLENFFSEYYAKKKRISSAKGLIDILCSLVPNNSKVVDWKNCLIPVSIEKISNPIHLITAGRRDDNYSNRIRQFDIKEFYEKYQGGRQLENLREQFLESYDYVLIDSRTGVTDFGGICTIQLPDILVLLYTPTMQSMRGVKDIAFKAVQAQMNIPFDREKLLTIPIPTRIDSQTEFKITQEWIIRFSKELSSAYEDWVPKAIPKKDLIELIKIPYIPFFSYGEQLPVVVQGVNDPAGLGYSYENIASILANNLEEIELFMERRDEYIRKAKRISREKELSQSGLNLFVSYQLEDKEYAKKLLTHLSIFKTLHNLNIWLDVENIIPGERWDKVISSAINNSDIFLILVSPSYMGSSNSLSELTYILNSKEDALIVPIIIKPVDLKLTNLINYKFLPSNGKPLTSYKNKDEAYLRITRELNSSIEKLKETKSKETEKEIIEQKQKDNLFNKSDLKRLKLLIQRNEIREAFDFLLTKIEGNNEYRKEERQLTIMMSEYSRNLTEYLKASITSEQFSLRNNKTISYLLDLIFKIEEKNTDHNRVGG